MSDLNLVGQVDQIKGLPSTLLLEAVLDGIVHRRLVPLLVVILTVNHLLLLVELLLSLPVALVHLVVLKLLHLLIILIGRKLLPRVDVDSLVRRLVDEQLLALADLRLLGLTEANRDPSFLAILMLKLSRSCVEEHLLLSLVLHECCACADRIRLQSLSMAFKMSGQHLYPLLLKSFLLFLCQFFGPLHNLLLHHGDRVILCVNLHTSRCVSSFEFDSGGCASGRSHHLV